MVRAAHPGNRFGGLVAVDDVSIDVPAGSILGVIGINGAGKTTLVNLVNGLYRLDSGRVSLDGRDVTGWSPHDVAKAGMGRTFQVPRVFRRMTLIDNLLVPVLDRPESDRALTERAEAVLDRFNLRALRHNYAEELSGGQQKLLELARVMMRDPKVVLLDEPFAGVNPTLCRLVIGEIEALNAAGTTFVLVSHDLTSIYRLSRRIVVMNQGQVIAEGDQAAIRSNPAVIEAYLGSQE
jgi:branched-chain amino acid transport system ATP-binding protein